MTTKNLITDTGRADFIEIVTLIEEYFNGLFTGDADRLERIFHSDTFLKGPGFRLSREEWLDAVRSRPIPRDDFPRNEFRISSIEVIQEQAMVKVICPLFKHDYLDFLGLLKEHGQWKIVNKMYVDTRAES